LRPGLNARLRRRCRRSDATGGASGCRRAGRRNRKVLTDDAAHEDGKRQKNKYAYWPSRTTGRDPDGGEPEGSRANH
jgi:hypothetical protein